MKDGLTRIIRNLSFVGAGLLVAGGAFSAGGCAPGTETGTEERRQTAADVSGDKGINAVEVATGRKLDSPACPSPPSDLTEAVTTAYSTDYNAVRNAAQRSGYQGYHLFTAIGETDAARAVLAEIFDVHGHACFDFEPTVEELNQRADRLMGREHRAPSEMDNAFALYKLAGNRDGQVQVADAYTKRVINERGMYLFDNAMDVHEELDGTEGKRTLIKDFFSQFYRMEIAADYLDRKGIEVTEELYRARGDYWLHAEDHPIHLVRAWEAYKAGDIKDRAQRLIDTIVAGEKWYDWHIAAKAALFLGNRGDAQQFARDYFTHGEGWEADNKELFDLVGLQFTPDIWSARGEYDLARGNILSAYDLFQEAGNRDGISRTVRAMTAPLPPLGTATQQD